MQVAKERIGYLTRKETFCAAHRLNSVLLSKEENSNVFGKCNHLNGHGHNYTVYVTVKGKISGITGMIVNISDLKPCIQRVISQLDHKNIDVDVLWFKDRCSTVENISVFFWDNLELPPGINLDKIVVHETDSNSAEYRGE